MKRQVVAWLVSGAVVGATQVQGQTASMTSLSDPWFSLGAEVNQLPERHQADFGLAQKNGDYDMNQKYDGGDQKDDAEIKDQYLFLGGSTFLPQASNMHLGLVIERDWKKIETDTVVNPGNTKSDEDLAVRTTTK